MCFMLNPLKDLSYQQNITIADNRNLLKPLSPTIQKLNIKASYTHPGICSKEKYLKQELALIQMLSEVFGKSVVFVLFVVWYIYVFVCCLLRPEICYVSSSSIAFYLIYWDGIFHWTGSSGIPQAPGILPSLPAQHWVSGACLAFYVAWVLVLAMQAYWLSSFAGSQFSSYILSTLYRIGRSHDQTPSPKLREKYN